MATVTYSQSGFYLHIVLKEVKRKKTHTTLIFVHDIGSIPTEIAGLGVCGTVTTGSHLFYSNISYSMFGLLCVTRGALVPRKRAYTAWRKLTANYLEFSRYFMLATPTSLICCSL